LNRTGIRSAVLIFAAVLIFFGNAVSARTYSVYYDCAPGVSTVIVLTNASEFELEGAVTLRLYDTSGSSIHESVHGLAAYESMALYLNGLLESTDESTWGLAEIDSQLLLQVGVWIGTEGDWLFVENYGDLLGSSGDLAIDTYWYGLNYANTQNRRTTVTILNPNDHLVLGSLYMYDAHGVLQYQRNLQLAARRPTHVALEQVAAIGEDVWGLVDVEARAPVLLICAYFDAEGYLIDVDVIDQPYYLEFNEQG
jgi:hypothetical protein